MVTEGRVPSLPEARRLVARSECAAHGHSWDVLSTLDGIPRRIMCGSCAATYPVSPPARAATPDTPG